MSKTQASFFYYIIVENKKLQKKLLSALRKIPKSVKKLKKQKKRLTEKLAELGWEYLPNPFILPPPITLIPTEFTDVTSPQDVMSYFFLMWPKSLFKRLLDSTKEAFPNDTSNFTEKKIAKFFGHIILLGVLGIRSYKSLWSRTPIEITYPGKESGLS